MRQLATVRQISNILPIEKADAIVLAQIDGWQAVVKKGEHQIGDLVVYLEVDSWVPHDLAPFLSKGKEPREFNGVKGERLRTTRLRGALSQGLVLPYATLGRIAGEGENVTEELGIQKWEVPIPAQLAGQVRGTFPTAIPKTDQERVQNIRLHEFLNESYEVTEKLHGSSCTFYLDAQEEFHVCSRNLDLKPDENNAYWKAAYKHNIEARMREHCLFGYAIQGELCGQGLNGNNYNLDLEFFAFDVFKEQTGYLLPGDRRDLVALLELPHVPVISHAAPLHATKEEILQNAEGHSSIANCLREGLVYKSTTSGKSFKAVSNSWLLQYE